jgi:hypothetical protein
MSKPSEKNNTQISLGEISRFEIFHNPKLPARCYCRNQNVFCVKPTSGCQARPGFAIRVNGKAVKIRRGRAAVMDIRKGNPSV